MKSRNNVYNVKIDGKELARALSKEVEKRMNDKGDRGMKMSSRMSMICYFMENNGIKHGEKIFLNVDDNEIYFENYIFGLGDDECEFNFTGDYISIVDTDGYDLTIAKNGEIAVFVPGEECYCGELQECLTQAEEDIQALLKKVKKQQELIDAQAQLLRMYENVNILGCLK